MNADRLWAQDVLRERGGSLTAKQMRAFTLTATGGDRQAADQAYARRRMQEQRREQEERERMGFNS